MSRRYVPALIAGGAATAAGLAGYYYYKSKKAKRSVRALALRAEELKDEIVRRARSLKHITRKEVLKTIDTVAATYMGVRDIDPNGVRATVSELKRDWQKIAGEVRKEIRKTGMRVRKTVKTRKHPAR